MNKRMKTLLSAGLITVIASSNVLATNALSKNVISNNNTGYISKSNDDFSAYQQEVLRLVNAERTKRGLKPLTLNTKLSNVATLKSQDMINKNYFSHTSPTYGSPFNMIKQFGISYTAAAENIAKGQKTPAQVVNAWMNSSGHRANILNANYTDLGVGVAKSSNGTMYWTQIFIKPSGNSNGNTGTNKPSDDNTNNNNNSNNNTDTNKPSQGENTSSNDFSAYQQEVLRLVNVERTKRGLKPLTLNTKLSNVATLKSQDMINKNYFSHTSPTYGSPFNMMKQFGINYTAAAENIAKGQKTPAQVVNAWMNSSGHRANILNANYTDLGVGVAKSSNGTMYWTQMFIKPSGNSSSNTVKPGEGDITNNGNSNGNTETNKPSDDNTNNNNSNNNTDTNKPSQDENTSNNNFTSFQQEVLRLVNVERTKRGLKPLTLNTKLSNVATLKSQDMINKNYFSHTSPTYGSPFNMMQQYGISYRTAGENIAMGQTTPAQVMNAWMNSSGHRANILNANYTELGVGVAKSSNGTIYWTQMFIG